MAKTKKEKEIDLIRDPDISFADAQQFFSARLKEKGITQKQRMSYSLQLSVAERALGNLPISFKLLADCEKYILSYGAPEEKSAFLFVRSMHLSNQAKYEEAMTLALRCLHLAQGADFPIVILRALACCGRICYRLLMYSEALDYMIRGLELARQVNNSKQILLFMYQVVDIKKQLLDAKEALKEIEALANYRRQGIKSEADIVDALINESAARTAIETGDVKKAKQYMSLAIAVRKSLKGDTTMLSDHYSVAGKISTAENDEKGMLAYTQKCIELAKENQQPLGEFYAHVERFYHYMTHSIVTKAKKQLEAVKVHAARIRSALTDHELDLALMKYAQYTGDSGLELQCLKRIYDYRTSSQQQVVAHRLIHITAIHQLEIKEREGELMKRELNLKSQELNLTNHHLQQRNDLLNELKESINSLKKENTKREVVFQTLFKKIDVAFNKEENEKDLFKAKFDTTNADFIYQLSQQYPRLSPTECRICALLHSGFNTKEIATLLSTSLRNIETHRLNVRKKLKLKRTDNLQLILAAVRG